MEYKEKQPMFNDCMKWLKFTCSDIFQPKPVMVVVYATFTIHFVVMLLHMIYFVHHPDLDIIIKYFPTLSIHIFGAVVFAAFMIKGKIVARLLEGFQLWAIDSADVSTKRKIEREAFVATFFANLSYCTLFVFAIITSFSHKSNGEAFLVIKLMCQNSYPPQLILMYRILFALTICVSSVHAMQIIYGSLQAKFQIYLLQRHFQCITQENEERTLSVYGDQFYQSKIEKKLIFCIKRHQFLVNAFLEKIEEIGFFMVLFVVAGGILGMGCSAFMYTCYQAGVYWLAALSLAEYVILYMGFIVYGQKFEERTEDLLEYVIRDNRWYLWNSRNKRILLNALPALQKKLQIKFISDLCINYRLGVAVAKAMFSVGNVYIQMRLRTMRLDDTEQH